MWKPRKFKGSVLELNDYEIWVLSGTANAQGYLFDSQVNSNFHSI